MPQLLFSKADPVFARGLRLIIDPMGEKMRKTSVAKLYVMYMIVLLMTVFAGISYAGDPIPYTDEALNRLVKAGKKIELPSSGKNDSSDYKLKTYIAYYKKLFSTAGFDFEKSVTRVISDIMAGRSNMSGAAVVVSGFSQDLVEMHEKMQISPNKYLTKECAQSVTAYSNLLRLQKQKAIDKEENRNAVAEAQEWEKNRKHENERLENELNTKRLQESEDRKLKEHKNLVVSNLLGTYGNMKKHGIKVNQASDDTISFNLINDNEFGGVCSIASGTAVLDNFTKNDTNLLTLDFKYDDQDCSFMMQFREGTIEINSVPEGECRKECKGGGFVMGLYKK